MSVLNHSRKFIGRALAGLAGVIAFGAICWLVYTVEREMDALSSARSDNAQWSLAQTEVEFLDFANAVAIFEESPAAIRQRFDIFYSRVQTIEVAQVYQSVRENVAFRGSLTQVRAFLDIAVPIIDLSDDALIGQIDTLQAIVAYARTDVRRLSNTGLSIFAVNADKQRAAVAATLGKLALALAVVIGALGFAVVYLNRLNATNVRSEREQKEVATRMNTVIETSLDGVIVCDDRGIVLEYSQAAETIFGFNAAEAIGKDLADLIIPDNHRAAHQNGMRRIQSGGAHFIVGTGRVRMDALRKDRSLFPVEFSIQAAQTSKGQIYIAFLRDVSSTVAAEQALVTARDTALASEKLKTDFLATMSHEIRTPLNGLLGNLSLLADTERSERQGKYINNMETSGRLLMSHISDVLDITRYDAGVLALDIVPMNITILLQDIIDSQSAMAVTSSTTLNWAWHGPKRDWVLTDPDRVQLILINLIGNAVKFTRGGHITVKAEIIDPKDPASPLRFCVTDTGPGIAPALIPNIFDDFVTGNAAYDRDVGGTGLGLSIAKRFVTALGGTISVKSDLGKGSTFEVVLPMPPAPQNSTDPKPSPEVREDVPLSILIVEDNEINRVVAREMLEAAGHTVTEAHNGKEGVSHANQTHFDVILMDISMPVMDGRAAARLIKSGDGPSAHTPIIALTAHASHEDQVSFAEAGMVTTLTKPISRDDLRNALSGIDDPSRTAKAAGDKTPVPDMTQLPIYAELKSRFIAELDALQTDLQNGDLTLADIGHRAHHAAGSAATFQTETIAEPLRHLAIAARAADDAQIDAACAAFTKAWQAKRAFFTEDVLA